MEINDLKLYSDFSVYQFEKFLKKLYLDIFHDKLSIKTDFNFDDVCLNKEIVDIIQFNYDNLKEKLLQDLSFYLESDPAINSKEEVIFTYPGLKAIYLYRIAHLFDENDIPILPRFISEYAHTKTGIDINPRAVIGCPFFIDHGTGIVIGETSIIGNYVKLYHGVTLGASHLKDSLNLKHQKRHPTIGNHVTIYANATILGGNTIIGSNSVIGSGIMVTNCLEENTLIYLKNNEVIQKIIK